MKNMLTSRQAVAQAQQKRSNNAEKINLSYLSWVTKSLTRALLEGVFTTQPPAVLRE